MANSFDDLIPKKEGQGAFDDLIPKNSVGKTIRDLALDVGAGLAVDVPSQIYGAANAAVGGYLDPATRSVTGPVMRAATAVGNFINGEDKQGPTNEQAPTIGQALGKAGDAVNNLHSDYRQAQEAQRTDAVNKADGFWDETGTALKETLSRPSLLAGDIARSGASMFMPGIAANKLTKAFGGNIAETAMREAVERGATREIAQQAGNEAIDKFAERAATGTTGLVQVGGGVNVDTINRIHDTPQEAMNANPEYQTLIGQGLSDVQARDELARKAGLTATAIAAPISIAASKLTGAGGQLAQVATGRYAGKTMKDLGVAAGKEALQEYPESFGETYAQGKAAQQYGDITTDPTKGAYAAGAMGALAGAAMGAGEHVIGGMFKKNPDDPANAPAGATPPPPGGTGAPGATTAGGAPTPPGSAPTGPTGGPAAPGGDPAGGPAAGPGAPGAPTPQGGAPTPPPLAYDPDGAFNALKNLVGVDRADEMMQEDPTRPATWYVPSDVMKSLGLEQKEGAPPTTLGEVFARLAPAAPQADPAVDALRKLLTSGDVPRIQFGADGSIFALPTDDNSMRVPLNLNKDELAEVNKAREALQKAHQSGEPLDIMTRQQAVRDLLQPAIDRLLTPPMVAPKAPDAPAEPPAPPAGPLASAASTVTQNLFPFGDANLAQKQADSLTNSTGRPHEVIDHPTVAGRFAAVPKQEKKDDGQANNLGTGVPASEQRPDRPDGGLGLDGHEGNRALGDEQPAAGLAGEPAAQDAAGQAGPDGGNPGPVAPASKFEEAAQEAHSSPANDLQATDAQIKANNAKLGHGKMGGHSISVENPAGSERSGTDPDTGEVWTTKMADTYGYFKGVPARAPDKEHVDTFVKQGTPDDWNGKAYIIDQNDAAGEFDEPKVVLGADSLEDARATYLRNYSPGFEERIRGIREVTNDELKALLGRTDTFDRAQPQYTQGPSTAPRDAITTGPIAPAEIESKADEVMASLEAYAKQHGVGVAMTREKVIELIQERGIEAADKSIATAQRLTTESKARDAAPTGPATPAADAPAAPGVPTPGRATFADIQNHIKGLMKEVEAKDSETPPAEAAPAKRDFTEKEKKAIAGLTPAMGKRISQELGLGIEHVNPATIKTLRARLLERDPDEVRPHLSVDEGGWNADLPGDDTRPGQAAKRDAITTPAVPTEPREAATFHHEAERRAELAWDMLENMAQALSDDADIAKLQPLADQYRGDAAKARDAKEAALKKLGVPGTKALEKEWKKSHPAAGLKEHAEAIRAEAEEALGRTLTEASAQTKTEIAPAKDAPVESIGSDPVERVRAFLNYLVREGNINGLKAGHHAEDRQALLSELEGKPVPKSRATLANLRDAIVKAAGLKGSTDEQKNYAIKQWLRNGGLVNPKGGKDNGPVILNHKNRNAEVSLTFNTPHGEVRVEIKPTITFRHKNGVDLGLHGDSVSETGYRSVMGVEVEGKFTEANLRARILPIVEWQQAQLAAQDPKQVAAKRKEHQAFREQVAAQNAKRKAEQDAEARWEGMPHNERYSALLANGIGGRDAEHGQFSQWWDLAPALRQNLEAYFAGRDNAPKAGPTKAAAPDIAAQIDKLNAEKATPNTPKDTQKPSAKAAAPVTDRRAAAVARLKKTDPFLALIADRGVALKLQADLGLEKGMKGNRMVSGIGPVLRNAGLNLDELANAAMDAGFLTQADIDDRIDTGAINKMTDLIYRAVAKKEVIPPLSSMDETAEQIAERVRESELIAEAESMGINTDGMAIDDVADAVFKKLQENIGINESEYDAIDQAADDLQADISDAELDLALDLALTNDSPQQELSDEEIDRLFAGPATQSPAAETFGPDTEAAGAGAETRQGQADRQDPEPAAKLDDFDLTGETPDEARAKIRAAEAQAAAAAKADAEARRKEAADREVGSFTLTGSDRPADVLAAQGQGDIFAAPAAPASPTAATNDWTPDGLPEGKLRDLAIWNGILGLNNDSLPSRINLQSLQHHLATAAKKGDAARWHFADLVNRRIGASNTADVKAFKKLVDATMLETTPPVTLPEPQPENGRLFVGHPVEPLKLPKKLPASSLVKRAIDHVNGEDTFRTLAQVHLNQLAENGLIVPKDELVHELEMLAYDILSDSFGDKGPKFQGLDEDDYPPKPGMETAEIDDPGMERMIGLFPDPGTTVNAVKQAAGQMLTRDQALAKVAEWKAEAKRQGETDRNHNKVILSLFDASGVWSQPYVDAGYTVIRYDLNHGDNLVEQFPMHDIVLLRASGKEIAGVIAQPPCTSFSNAGRWSWPTQHDIVTPEYVEKKYGKWATAYFDRPFDVAETLAMAAQAVIEFAAPTEFYVMENPRGRIADVLGLPTARMVIQPHVYGDAYTKETFLYGEFNTDLPTANVSPKEEDGGEGSKIWKLRGDKADEHAERSLTPEGFAYAWFMANNARAAIAPKPVYGMKEAVENQKRFNDFLDRHEAGQAGADEKLPGWYGDVDQPLRFESGMTNAKDFARMFAANKNVGISLRVLANSNIEKLAEAMAKAENAWLFVDTGAFSAFMANVKVAQSGQAAFEELIDPELGAGEVVNFERVMDLHHGLQTAISKADPTGYTSDRVFYVMPDIVGNQALSLELAAKYREAINGIGAMRPIVPLQGGELTLTQAYEQMMRNIGLDPATDISPIIGLPSKAEAVSNEEITALLKAHGDRINGLHVLGAATEKALTPRLEAIRASGYDGNVSADAFTLRGKLVNGTPRSEAFLKITGALTMADIEPPKNAGPDLLAVADDDLPSRVLDFLQKADRGWGFDALGRELGLDTYSMNGDAAALSDALKKLREDGKIESNNQHGHFIKGRVFDKGEVIDTTDEPAKPARPLREVATDYEENRRFALETARRNILARRAKTKSQRADRDREAKKIEEKLARVSPSRFTEKGLNEIRAYSDNYKHTPADEYVLTDDPYAQSRFRLDLHYLERHTPSTLDKEYSRMATEALAHKPNMTLAFWTQWMAEREAGFGKLLRGRGIDKIEGDRAGADRLQALFKDHEKLADDVMHPWLEQSASALAMYIVDKYPYLATAVESVMKALDYDYRAGTWHRPIEKDEAAIAAHQQAWMDVGERIDLMLPDAEKSVGKIKYASLHAVGAKLGLTPSQSYAAYNAYMKGDASYVPSESPPTLPGTDSDAPMFSRKKKEVEREWIPAEDYRPLNREIDNLLPHEQKVFDAFIASRPDGKVLVARLKEHRGTPWARQAIEGVFVRQAIAQYAINETPAFQSMMDHEDATTIRTMLQREGMDAVFTYLDVAKYMGAAQKPINNVSSSFINCNPSRDCAEYCYATKGHYRFAAAVVKSELVTLAVERDPAHVAERVAAAYKGTNEYINHKALRLFDKGDGNVAWLPFIRALNAQGVRTHIFSKNPDFLRAVPEQNVRLLSIDGSNMALADANPDLQVAFVYDKGPGQVEFLAKMVLRDQLQVVLPIKLGQRVLHKEEIAALKSAVPGVKPFMCPIDAGVKKISPKGQPHNGWNCTKCDAGGGIGCYTGEPTKMTRQVALRRDPTIKQKADMVVELSELIRQRVEKQLNERLATTAGTAGAAGNLAAIGRAGEGISEGILRQIDQLVDDLLAAHEPDAETANALAGDGGIAGNGGGVQDDTGPTGRRTIPIAKARDKDGNPLASRNRAAATGYPVESLQAALAGLTRHWTGAPKGGVHGVATVGDLPAALLAKIPTDVLRDMRGVFDPATGAAYLIANRLNDAREAQFVLAHEVLGHGGLRALLGKDALANELNRLRLINPALAAEARSQAQRFGLDITTATEEALADWQGEGRPLKGWQAFMARVQNALRAIGFHAFADWLEGRTQAETLALLKAARETITGNDAPHAFGEKEALLYSSDRAPVWTSALAEQLGKMPTKVAPAAQWANALKGLQSKGVKADEIEWSGVKEWLQAQDGKVTKEALLDFINGSVQVGEVIKGEPDPAWEAKKEALEARRAAYIDEQVEEARKEFESNLDRRVDEHMENVWGSNYVAEAEDDEGNPVWEHRSEYSDGAIDTFDTEAEAQESVDEANDHELQEAERDIRRDIGEFDEDTARHYAEREWDNEPDSDLDDESNDPQFSNWRTVPGGDEDTYREMLITLTDPPAGQVFKRQAVFDKYQAQIDAVNRQMQGKTFDEARPERDQIRQLQRDRDLEAEAVAGELDGFKEDHWKEGNVLAHVRFDARTNAAGERVLQIHEIQSDWAEQGRSKGFRDDTALERLAINRELDKVGGIFGGEKRMNALAEAYAERTGEEALFANDTTTSAFDASPEGQEWNRINKLAEREYTLRNKGGLHPAPFVKKTEAWVSLALKRIMTYAAQNGFDHVALPTGDQANAAFSLEKRVGIDYKKKPDGKIWLYVFNPETGGHITERTVAPEDLPGIVGKEVADKMLRGEGREQPDATLASLKQRGEPTGVERGQDTNYGESWYITFRDQRLGTYGTKEAAEREAERIRLMVQENPATRLEGDDLKIGGDPMRKYYDQMVVNIANDLLKKFGGERVTPAKANPKVKAVVEQVHRHFVVRNAITGEYFVSDTDNPVWHADEEHATPAYGRSLAETWAENLNANNPISQPGFAITPALRDRAMGGLPLFSRPDAAKVDGVPVGKNVKLTVSRADANQAIQSIRAGFASRFGTDVPIGIKLVTKMDDLPQVLRDSAARQGVDYGNGVFYDNTVYVIQDAHRTAREIEETVFHELYGHAATRALFGDKWREKELALFHAVGGIDGIQALGQKVGMALGPYIEGIGNDTTLTEDERRALLLEEVMAHLAEQTGSWKLAFKAFVGAVRAMLRDLGFKSLAQYDDRDLAYLLRRGSAALGRNARAAAGLPAFSRGAGEDRSRAKPGANIERLAGLLGPQLYGDMTRMGPVTVKELFQNSFDALKGAIEKGERDYGQIGIDTDRYARTITIRDNGTGMTPDIINKAFLTIAGTSKETERSSGGFGIAKMLFLFGNENLKLVTVRDGVEATLETTGAQLMAAFSDPEAAPEIVTKKTDAPSGTVITVKVPETYRNPSSGQDDRIDFPSDSELKQMISDSPLFENIRVGLNGESMPVGDLFPKDDYTTFSTVKFDWGTARIIISKKEVKDWRANTNVLSNGLFQFGFSIKDDPRNQYGDNLPRKLFINLEPRVKPEEPGYPFALNRQGFSPAVQSDFSKIAKYLSIMYGANKAAETAAGFGAVEYVNPDNTVGDKLSLAPKIDADARAGMMTINEGDVIEIHEGRMTVNGREVPELTAADIEKVKIDATKFKIAQSQVDPSRPMIHDNIDIKYDANANAELEAADRKLGELKAARAAAEKAFGEISDAWNAAADQYGYQSPEAEALREKSKEVDAVQVAAIDAYWKYKEEYDLIKGEAKEAMDAAVPRPITEVMRERFGKRFDQYLANIGRVFMKLRDAVHAEDDMTYRGMENVPVGVSFDTDYYGVHFMVPFRGMFLNPAMSSLDDATAAGPRGSSRQIANAMMTTMIHEIAHFPQMNHSESFISEMQRITALLESSDQFNIQSLRQSLRLILDQNHDIYKALNVAFRIHPEHVANRGVKLKDSGAYHRRHEGRADDLGGAGPTGQADRGLAGRRGGGAGAAAGMQDGGRAGGQAAGQRDVNSIGWSEDRLDRLMAQYAYTNRDTKSKAYATWITPDQYLSLTTRRLDRIAAESRPLDKAELARQSQEIFLQVDDLARGERHVTGHEGRHRAYAMKQAGITRFPVVIMVGQGTDLAPMASIRLDGQRFQDGSAPAYKLELTDLVPISYAHAATLRAQFGPQAAADAPLFSRRPGDDPPVFSRGRESIQAMADLVRSGAALRKIAAQVKEMLGSYKAFNNFNLYDKTLSTQYNKARKDADFRAVFDPALQQIDDTAHFAIEAESQARDVLVRIDTAPEIWNALKKGGTQYAADMKAIAAPLFANIEGKEGVRQIKFTERELRRDYGLNERQIDLYKQVRAAVDTSIERLAQTTVMSMGQKEGVPVAHMKDWTLDDTVAAVKEGIIERHEEARLREEAKANLRGDPLPAGPEQPAQASIPGVEPIPRRIDPDDVPPKSEQVVLDRIDKIVETSAMLQTRAYMPAMRFGQYAISVRDPEDDNKLRYFYTYESQFAAHAAYQRLVREFPDMVVTRDVMNDEQHRLFKGVSPETVALFAKAAGIDNEQFFKDYIALATASRAARIHELNRQGIGGFSEDVPRVVASFLLSNARQAAINVNAQNIADALGEKSLKVKGDVYKEAQRLVEYMNDPVEEARGMRSFMFMYFIGGSVASALTNLTQPMLQTLPWLTEHIGAKAPAAVLSAAKMAATGKYEGRLLQTAMKRADEDGLTQPKEIHALMADAGATIVGSNFRARALLSAWSSFFSQSEAYNRRLTFIAAFQAAIKMGPRQLQAKGFADAYDFARTALHETQGLFSKVSRPNWARGSVGATLFTFKIFSITYLEMLMRMPWQQKAIALSLLTLAAGVEGWPFAENLEDIIDTLGQAFGYNTNSKKALRQFAADTLGETLGHMAVNGVTGVTGADLSGRVGLGRMLPGTDALKQSDQRDTGRSPEAAGAFGSMVAAAHQAIMGFASGNPVAGARAMMPTAVKNAWQGIDMGTDGVYRDGRNRVVMPVSAYESALKFFGFQPDRVARQSDIVGDILQDKNMMSSVKGSLMARWATAIAEKDQEKIAATVARWQEWNASNPAYKIIITPAELRNAVKEQMLDRATRTIKAMPKTMRAEAVAELAPTR